MSAVKSIADVVGREALTLKKVTRRTLYLGYYLKQLEWQKFLGFAGHVRRQRDMGTLALGRDVIGSVYEHNIGLIDYFYFKFYEKDDEERRRWVGTGYKYEYDLVMNPPSERHVLQNKLEFFRAFEPFIRHAMCTIDDLNADNEAAARVLNNPSGKIAVKDALGQCGWQVEILGADDFSPSELATYMNAKGFNMAEEFIVQHPDLRRLSDSGLNTVRVITQLRADGGVDFIGPTLRITVNSPVDNMAVGNIAAPIDVETGRVSGPGVYQDIIKLPEEVHPISGEQIVGFQVPFWDDVRDLCRRAALHDTRNRSIGWDVAVTERGPSFVEGNHNWCKLLWQLPAGEGLKHVLDGYKQQYRSEFE